MQSSFNSQKNLFPFRKSPIPLDSFSSIESPTFIPLAIYRILTKTNYIWLFAYLIQGIPFRATKFFISVDRINLGSTKPVKPKSPSLH